LGGENLNLAVSFGTIFVIGLLTNLPPGDIIREAETPAHANRLIRNS
jgi:hypothetical protein